MHLKFIIKVYITFRKKHCKQGKYVHIPNSILRKSLNIFKIKLRSQTIRNQKMGFLPFVSRMWAEQQDGLFNLML